MKSIRKDLPRKKTNFLLKSFWKYIKIAIFTVYRKESKILKMQIRIWLFI